MWLLTTAWAGMAVLWASVCPVLGIHGKVLVVEGYRGGVYGSCQELNLTDTSPHPHSLSTTEGRRQRK